MGRKNSKKSLWLSWIISLATSLIQTQSSLNAALTVTPSNISTRHTALSMISRLPHPGKSLRHHRSFLWATKMNLKGDECSSSQGCWLPLTDLKGLTDDLHKCVWRIHCLSLHPQAQTWYKKLPYVTWHPYDRRNDEEAGKRWHLTGQKEKTTILSGRHKFRHCVLLVLQTQSCCYLATRVFRA